MTQTKFLRLFLLAVSIILVSGFLSSCKKDPGQIGLGLMDDELLSTGFTDTLAVFAHAVRVDSLRTDETTLNMLGAYADPVFGPSISNLVAELWMTSNNPNFGTNPVADSMVVYFHYTGGVYGNLATPLHVTVYELDEDIEFDSTYYSTRRCAFKPEPVGDFVFTPAPNDSVMDPDSTPGTPRLAIPLNLDFANRILQADTANFVDNVVFSDFMAGLYFAFEPITSPGEGSIFDVDLLNTRSITVLYYHNTTDTSTFSIRSSTYTPRYSQFEHDYTLASPELTAQLDGDTLGGREQLFVQPMGGVKTVIRIPDLLALNGDFETSVNEAKLIMEVYNQDTSYSLPANFELMMVNDDGSQSVIPDYSEGSSFYGGNYNAESGTYTFRITRYVQHVLGGDITNRGLELIVSGGSAVPERAVLYGTAPTLVGDTHDHRFRAQIIYTKIQ
ncbi:MAG: DUF4270 domain-containing protein [Bacteroidales bacterium]|nr:DUF4270 domain-containing protein [Bacteroidales bacterium]MDD3009715.1 DUF4270 domain-containing protein [Bacteroidales bacterium]MDD3960690.1 DUF4270 domain-containing protein [Bacteroidales bacterium]MDY0285012.1 DUF4270 domain-containing protein [Bacteroidales bacterium]